MQNLVLVSYAIYKNIFPVFRSIKGIIVVISVTPRLKRGPGMPDSHYPSCSSGKICTTENNKFLILKTRISHFSHSFSKIQSLQEYRCELQKCHSLDEA